MKKYKVRILLVMTGQCDLCNHFLAEVRTLSEPGKAGMWKDWMRGEDSFRTHLFHLLPRFCETSEVQATLGQSGMLGLRPVENSVRSI